jgi:hypothetical protein
MAEFVAKKDEFLVFERGPSVDVVLQWARYVDASDQCSLSRIWGGIHPPIDDIPGRLIGEKVGEDAFLAARHYFQDIILGIENGREAGAVSIFPNPVNVGNPLHVKLANDHQHLTVSLYSVNGALLVREENKATKNKEIILDTSLLQPGAYIISISNDRLYFSKMVLVR